MHGRFEVPRLWPTALSRRWHRQFTIETGVVRPEDGAITWMLSEPLSGRPRFDTVGGPYAVQREPFKTFRRSPATAVVFRAAPVQVFPMVDPTTMRRYRKLALLDAETMAEPRSFFVEIPIPQDSLVCYVPPETRLHLAFRRIAANQPRLQLGAVAMNAGEPIDDAAAQRATDDVGPGYLAADTPSIKNLELDAAMSMARLNAGRVRLQERHGMADEMVSAYSHKALALAEEAEAKAARGRIAEAKRTALHSIAYGSNIYPVIRQNASDAVVGILFYLFLAVPFAFYMEKLLIGQTDVRFQVLWQLVIFLVFFLLLRMVHPAYELVRNSYMILLGFLTFALALVVGTYVSHKFARNVGALTRSMHRQIETVDVSRAGAAATAFLLGLNNMRKRPVRTGLTVATLILITFVMICFTSVRSDVVDLQLPVGKASYTGLLIRDRALRDVSGALAETREAYGDRHVVAERSWGGNFATALDEIPELAIYAISRSADGRTYEAVANAVLGLTALEPRVTPIDKAFPVLKRWFDRDTEQVCMLPRTLADRLRIADEQVLDGTVKVKIGGLDYAVLGIFDESRLDALLDLDGQPILPVDLPSVQDPWQLGTGVTRTERTELPEDVPRLPAAQVLITTTGSMPEKTKVASVAVALRDMPYTEARKLILSQLERSGKPLYYGLDDVAYFGGKFRHRSIEGLVDLLLPIVVVAFTVLNTMCGSVYDRQDELYVFNAVGLAPAHIRFLFMAEASVYAVVGAVGGYLLAQAVATSVKAMGLEAGLTMNYSSLSAVLVSIVIMVVVLLSTVFPARMAARLAAPSSTATRQRHTAEGDVIELDLPFIFNQRDRVAIIAYFADWLENHGEGSSGAFYCSAPEVGIGAEPDGDLFPFIRTMTWLKPYDLGVSQRVELMVRHDPKTGGNVPIVAMTCRSGDRESWQRCCHAFIGRLRKRLLTWRAVGHEDRDRLLERGREMLGGVPSAPSPQDALNS
ncbi:MAG: hypothetical protein CMJ18_07015 [Phycisphaeraceae bacterium]|nr:hypothetical protein [Phycisphaeraceae bacterium]